MKSGWRANCLLTTFSHWKRLHAAPVWQMSFGTGVCTQQEWQLEVCRTHSHFLWPHVWQTDVFAMQLWLNPSPKGRPGYRLQGLTSQTLLSWPRVLWMHQLWELGRWQILLFQFVMYFIIPLTFWFDCSNKIIKFYEACFFCLAGKHHRYRIGVQRQILGKIKTSCIHSDSFIIH